MNAATAEDRDICPGPCNNRYRKARALYKDALRRHDEEMIARAAAGDTSPPPPPPAEPQVRAWRRDPVWCTRCAAGIHAQLSELDELISHLLAVPDLRGDPGQAGRISGTRDRRRSPSPWADDADELAAWARAWESAVRGTDPMPRRGYLSTELTASLNWLAAHYQQLINHPDIGEPFGAETRAWHRDLQRKAKAGKAVRHMGRPCPRCRRYTLWVTDGEDYIRCVNIDCARLLSREEYDQTEEGRIVSVRRGG